MQTHAQEGFEKALAILADEGINPQIRGGDRDTSHNASVGGASDSQHTHGTAMDFDISGLSDTDKQRTIEVFRGVGAQGFGIYTRDGESTGSLHIDFRESGLAIWGKDGSYSNQGKGTAWLPDWAQQLATGSTVADLSNTTPSATSTRDVQRDMEGSTGWDSNGDGYNPEEGGFLATLIMALIQAVMQPLQNETQMADLGELSPATTPNLRSGSNQQIV